MTYEEYDEFLTNAEERLYLNSNPDVIKAIADGNISSAKEHHTKYGAVEGRSWPNLHIHTHKRPLNGGRHAIFITTYLPSTSGLHLTRRLPETLRTLKATAYPGDIWIIDDGSTHPVHIDYLRSLPPHIKLVKHKIRGGISKAKNTCINLFTENKYDFGFLSDDDNKFGFGWWEVYLSEYEKTGFPHYCWTFENELRTPLSHLGYSEIFSNTCKTKALAGILLTITPEVVEKVGGFKVLPSPWGFEHIDYSRRIIKAGLIPYPLDVVNSSRYLTPNVYAPYSTSPTEEHLRGFHQNFASAEMNTHIFIKPEGGAT